VIGLKGHGRRNQPKKKNREPDATILISGYTKWGKKGMEDKGGLTALCVKVMGAQ